MEIRKEREWERNEKIEREKKRERERMRGRNCDKKVLIYSR